MRTESEIRERLKYVESFKQLSQPDADVFTNAPLAMIQLSLEERRNILLWVLGEKEI